MKWTRAVPTGPGWYWWRRDASCAPQAVRVSTLCRHQQPLLWAHGCGEKWGDTPLGWGGFWYGPVVPPEGECEGG